MTESQSVQEPVRPGAATELVNVAACLPQMAARQPERVAICQPAGRARGGGTRYRRITYAELDRQSDVVARGLAAIGIGQGVRTVLMVPPGPQFFALTFGMAKAGVVPIMVDPGLPLPYLKSCLDEAQPEAFIGSAKAHAARRTFGWARSARTHLVVPGPRLLGGRKGLSWSQLLRAGEASAAPAHAPTRAEDMAAILFTSGSTGVPKGAVYTHANFAAQVALLRQMSDVAAGEVDLPTFPLFALFDPALGMTTVVPDMDFTKPAAANPRRLVRAMTDEQVTNMFASPALLTSLVTWAAEQKVALPVRRVVSAGAPVPPAIVRKAMEVMPAGAKVITPYGATEALPVCGIDSVEILRQAHRTAEGAGVCVGRPVPTVDVRIIPVTDEACPAWHEGLALPRGQVGEIVVKGPQVTRSYYGRPTATRMAKIAEGEAFWHRMGDVGYFDDDGLLWFCGRKSHRVVLDDGRTMFTVACEGVFNAHPGVRRTALVAVRGASGTLPLLCIEASTGKRGSRQLVDELRGLGRARAATADISHFLFHPHFPVDIRHNAKIGREDLAVWAQARLHKAMVA